jgi:hypothetical protein
VDPEDTLMRCLEGWRVHYPLFFFLLRLFRDHAGGALCSLLNLLRGLKVEKGGGGAELADVSHLLLSTRVKGGRRGRFDGQHHIDAGIGLVPWIPRTP